MQLYTEDFVQYINGTYAFWDAQNEDGSNYFNSMDFGSYYESGLEDKIPLPDDVYPVIVYHVKNDSQFLEEDGESILTRLDAIDFKIIDYEYDETDEYAVTEDGLCGVYIFHDNEDLKYAVEKLEEFFAQKQTNKEY